MIIGLTGQTGAGKSTVSKLLQKYGCYHIDADAVAKEVIDNDESVKQKLREYFGDDVITEDNIVDRKKLAKKAFSRPECTNALNAITHPAVNREIQSIIHRQSECGVKAVIIDAIALFESGEANLCDCTVAVTAPKDIRTERIIQRDKISADRAEERINAQKDQQFFEKKSDYIIRNYSPYNIYDEVKKLAINLNLIKE